MSADRATIEDSQLFKLLRPHFARLQREIAEAGSQGRVPVAVMVGGLIDELPGCTCLGLPLELGRVELPVVRSIEF